LDNSPLSTESPNSISIRERSHRSSWVLLFSFVLGGLLLYLTLRDLDWAAFWNTIQHGRYEFILLTIPISSANYFIRTLRWSIFIRSEKKVPILSIFWANMLGYLGNTYLPARAGELLRSGFLGKKSGLGTSFVLATALIERLLDVIALVLIGSISLLWMSNISPLLTNTVRIMAMAGVVGMIIIFALPFQQGLILRFITWLPLPQKVVTAVSEHTTRFLIGMRSLQNGRRLTIFILLTGLIWFVDAFGTTIGVQIISRTLNIGQGLILLSALGLSSAIPVPGNVGVFQYVAVTVLMPFGFSSAEALAYITISQILNYIVVSFWGLLGLWQVNRNRQFSPADPQEI
jgi:uncharacterized protein (TIRG00374 family)